MPSNQPIVLLREVDGERYLPIWIGAVEATAIAFAQQGVVPPRPLTHDLIKDVLEATGNELTEVRITEIQRRRLLRRSWCSPPGSRSAPGPRTRSRWRCAPARKIVCAEEVLDEAGLEVPDEQEDEVEKFREFLDHVSPEDFEAPSPDRLNPQPQSRLKVATRRSRVVDQPSAAGLTLNCLRCNSTVVLLVRSRSRADGFPGSYTQSEATTTEVTVNGNDDRQPARRSRRAAGARRPPRPPTSRVCSSTTTSPRCPATSATAARPPATPPASPTASSTTGPAPGWSSPPSAAPPAPAPSGSTPSATSCCSR